MANQLPETRPEVSVHALGSVARHAQYGLAAIVETVDVDHDSVTRRQTDGSCARLL